MAQCDDSGTQNCYVRSSYTENCNTIERSIGGIDAYLQQCKYIVSCIGLQGLKSDLRAGGKVPVGEQAHSRFSKHMH